MKKIMKDFIVKQLKKIFYKEQTTFDHHDIAIAVDREKTLSPNGAKLITNFEGLALVAYQCPAKVWTIGSGTTVYPSGQSVQQGDTCSKEQALTYKTYDLMRFSKLVNQTVNVPLTQNQFDALVSLAYNIGANAFRQSTLLKKLNIADYDGAAEQFLVWNKSKGKVLKGLVNRRTQERALFLT